MPKGLTDIPQIKVGHATNREAATGCTVILCEQGAVAGVDIGGGATGTEEIDAMSPGHVAPFVHGLVFAGGSAFGLEAASGVRKFLEKKKVGFPVGVTVVPIVPAAILFDLAIGRHDIRPNWEMGLMAAEAATDGPVQEGSVGAGTGATVGKLYGMKQAMKGGVGTATVTVGGNVLVSALAVVNAYGDIRNPADGKLIAGTRESEKSRNLIGTEQAMLRGATGGFGSTNTTLVAVATNARLTKVGAQRVAKMAQAGVLRTLSPGHTTNDGDIVVALSCGKLAAEVNALGVAAAEAVAQSILRGVRLAKSLAGVPGLGG